MLACILYFIPLKIGVGVNNDIPIIGSIEQFTQEQVDSTLLRAGSAYATLKAVQITPKMFENVALPFISLKLGALLSPIVEQLDMLDSVLFYALLVAFGEKFLLGWITYVVLHWLIPIGLVFYALGKISMIRKIGVFFVQLGILAYLLLPTTAFINQSIYDAFNIDKRIEIAQEQGKEIEGYQDELEKIKESNQEVKIQKEVQEEAREERVMDWMASIASRALDKTKEIASDLYDGAKDVVSGVTKAVMNPKETINQLGNALNNTLNSFMEMVAVFVLTTIIVPIGVFFGFVAIFKQICNPQIKTIIYSVREQVQKPTRKVKEIKEKSRNQGRER